MMCGAKTCGMSCLECHSVMVLLAVVLVTTRNDRVAHGMKAQHLHHVDKLDAEDAWILLKNQILADEGDETDIDGLKGVGLKIVERCDRLPLAVKVIGGLLRNKTRTRDAWMDVCNHDTWSVKGIHEDINKAVYLSYEDLPSHLKQCFVYCSFFPKDELIRWGDIVLLWMAEGYVCNKMSSKLPEELGLEYFSELVSRNLLEPKKGFYGKDACNMHDVVRSFAQYMIRGEGLLLSEAHDVNIIHGNPKLCHLSISNKPSGMDTLQNQTSLRTLMLFGSIRVDLKDLLNNFSCLRVLYLDGVNVAEIPELICHLKHLRHLCLSNTSISMIPQNIGDLKFLQALELAGCGNVSQLPNSILKLRMLRLLNLRCTSITSVPRGFQKLKDLVHILGFTTHSEENIDGWCSLEELGPLPNLQILEISHLEKAPSGSMAAKATLSRKIHLTYLYLIFTSRLREDGEVEDNIGEEEHSRVEEVLANLCPPTCIESLVIKGYFARGLPQWMRSMSAFGSLRRLQLDDYACCTQLPNGLGQLPFLDYFWVERAPSIQRIGHELLHPSLGDGTIGKDGISVLSGTQNKRSQPHHISRDADVAFPKLVELGFDGMLGWTEWEWEQQVPAMPALEVLRVSDCKLQRLPAGLAHHACRLRELCLVNIPHLVSVENFPSLVKLRSYNNQSIVRISNNPSLQWISIRRCPALKELDSLSSLRRLEWWDLDAEALPQYLGVAKLNKLHVGCSLRLLKLIALQDESSEWGKIRHVQQLKAIGWTSEEDEVDRHIYYTKEPYSFDVDLGESTDGDAEEEDEAREE